ITVVEAGVGLCVAVLGDSFFFFSSRRRHTRFSRDWSSDVCSSDLYQPEPDCEPIVVFAARLLRDKGLVEFVNAAEMLKKRGVSRSEERRVGKECRCGWWAYQ